MFQKICAALSTVILAVLLVVAGLLVVPYLLGYQEMAVLTGSMTPALPVGTLIYVKATDPAQLQVGDVVTYQLDAGSVVTHRVVSVDTAAQTVTTKGDANQDNDGAIAFDRIVGKMAFSVPFLGYVSIMVHSKTGVVIVCSLLVVIILLTFLPEIFSPEDKGEKGDKHGGQHAKR